MLKNPSWLPVSIYFSLSVIAKLLTLNLFPTLPLAPPTRDRLSTAGQRVVSLPIGSEAPLSPLAHPHICWALCSFLPSSSLRGQGPHLQGLPDTLPPLLQAVPAPPLQPHSPLLSWLPFTLAAGTIAAHCSLSITYVLISFPQLDCKLLRQSQYFFCIFHFACHGGSGHFADGCHLSRRKIFCDCKNAMRGRSARA